MPPLLRAAGGLSLAFLLFSQTAASSSRPSSLQQLLDDRRAVEEVLWKHRIWPATNPGPKPDFARAFPNALLEARVRDNLARSTALAALWNRPLSGKDLQAELNRMVTHSHDPGLLQEMFSALSHDPTRIAYALALPALADRRLRSYYDQDDRFHGSLRAAAEQALAGGKEIASATDPAGEHLEVEYARREKEGKTAPTELPGVTLLSPEEWDSLIGRLADMFGIKDTEGNPGPDKLLGRLPLHRAGELRDESDRFVSTTLLERSADRIKLELTTWRKRPFESWWEETKVGLSPEMGIPASYSYMLPEAPSPGCQFDTWQGLHTPVPSTRTGFSMVWTGSEMIVWGGLGTGDYVNTGHRYNPATDTWTPTGVDASTPAPRSDPTAVWTGTEMIVWGGRTYTPNGVYGSGGRYNPLTDSWSGIKTDVTSPTPRWSHSAVWTGSRMLVWGGLSSYAASFPSTYLNTGAQYDPASDTWTAIRSDATAPLAREGHVAVWTGTEMIVWGGRVYWLNAPWQWGDTSTGGRYNPATDTWTAFGGAPLQARSRNTAVWTGTQMIIWGGVHRDMTMQGQPTDTYFNSGDRYNPSNNTWTATRLDATTPPLRSNHSAVWTGNEMIIWGGEYASNGTQYRADGKRYSPGTDTWISMAGGPQGRSQHGAVWTGSEMIVWGGIGYGGTLTTGGRFNPSSNSWIPTAVEPVYNGTAIWTGSEMIVWGSSSAVPTGKAPAGLYSPATDSWRTGSAVSAPEGRSYHQAVWTGTEMIVWGGYQLSTGGRYNPTLDSWMPTKNDASTPISRQSGYPVAVWTGSQMLLWGGFCTITGPCAGARYDPATNTWTPMRSDATAPEQRRGHTGIWTGQELIIYGGENVYRPSSPYFTADYARYDPNLDQWTVTATDARLGHTAVWTGTEMIVWGGAVPSGGSYVASNTGQRYDPAGNQFSPVSTGPGAPSARWSHTAVWTGSEMIVWGGFGSGNYQNDGARYAPGTDSWIATKVDATTPTPRSDHLAVWTGNEMLVWSGHNNGNPFGPILDTGGRYCSCPAPVTYYQDLDGDGQGNSAASAPFCGAPVGSWTSTGGDCNDQDSASWSIPGEARDLAFGDAVSLVWSAPAAPGSSSLTYDLIRSPDRSDFVASGICAVTNTSSTGATDATTPSPGSALYYLVRAENACPGSGPLGTDWQGNPRSALNCP